MKILTIGIVCPYNFLIPGGVQENTRNLGAALTQLGHNVIYFSPHAPHSKLPQPHVSIGFNLRLPTPNGSWGEISIAKHSNTEIKCTINKYKIDVMHFQELLSPFSSWTWLKSSNVPNVATFNAAWEIKKNYNKFGVMLKIIELKIKPYLDQSITASKIAELCNANLLNHNIVIPPAIDMAIIQQKYTKPKEYINSGHNIVFVGRFDERKGAPQLIKALSLINTPNKITLHIIGAGPGNQKLADLIDKYNLNHKIIFHGKVDNLTKYAFLQHADALVAPATHGESFGMVLIEALAAGCPVIAGNNDGYKETLKDYPYQQYIVDPKNHQVFSNAITSLLTNLTHQKNIKLWAKTFVTQFDSINLAKKHLEIYQKIVVRN